MGVESCVRFSSSGPVIDESNKKVRIIQCFLCLFAIRMEKWREKGIFADCFIIRNFSYCPLLFQSNWIELQSESKDGKCIPPLFSIILNKEMGHSLPHFWSSNSYVYPNNQSLSLVGFFFVFFIGLFFATKLFLFLFRRLW